MALIKKFDGAPNQRFFECPETVSHFDSVRSWLTRNCKKYIQAGEPVTNKSLANLVVSLLQFQEEHFGRKVNNPPLTKLPMSLFMDFKSNGSLCHVLAAVYKFKTEQGWRRFDFPNPSRVDRNVEMFIQIEKALQQSSHEFLPRPQIYIMDSVDPELTARLKDIIKRHQSMHVESEDDATHIIYPIPDSAKNEVNRDFVRPVMRRERNTMLHWWYTPDSYDTWVTDIHIDLDVDDIYNPDGAYEVDARWLLDLHNFNEWVNEEDYLIDEASGKKGRGNGDRTKLTPEEIMTTIEERREKKKGSKRKRTPSPTSSNPETKKKSKKSSKSGGGSVPVLLPPIYPKAGGFYEKFVNKFWELAQAKGSTNKDLAAKEAGELYTSKYKGNMAAIMEYLDKEVVFRTHKVAKSSSSSKKSKKKPIKEEVAGGEEHEEDEEEDEAPAEATDVVEAVSLPRSQSPVAAEPTANKGKEAAAAPEVEKPVVAMESEQEEQKANSPEPPGASKDGQKKAAEETAVDQTHYIIIPSYTAWFDYNSINGIEKRALPEFFNQKNKSKTPEVYIAYRNFMVDTYRLNPREYLTSTACRRNLAGDVCSLTRVHAFLEQWGLINYQVDAENRAIPMGPPSTSHFMVLADTPSGLSRIDPPRLHQPSIAKPINAVIPQPQAISEPAKSKDIPVGGSTVSPLPAGEASSSLPAPLAASTVSSEGEAGRDLSASTLASGVKGEFGLQSELYKETHKGKEWTDQEVLLLLEALEMYKDDWNKVSEHVGSKTQDECILHFLRLPIEDSFLEKPEMGEHLGPLAFQPSPFSQAGNPIMSTVAFLASLVDPKIAFAASRAALEEFSKMKDGVPPHLLDEHVKMFKQAFRDGKTTNPKYGLEKTLIAGATEDGPGEDAPTSNVKADAKGGEEVEPSADMVEKDATKVSMSISEPTDESPSSSKAEGMDISDEASLQAAAAEALSSAAVKAKHLASIEEKRIKTSVALLVETQMKKLDIKLKHFEELEAIMDRERESLEYQRQQLLQERQQFHQEMIKQFDTRALQMASRQVGPPPSAAQGEADAGQQTGPMPPTATLMHPQVAGTMHGSASSLQQPPGPATSLSQPPPGSNVGYMQSMNRPMAGSAGAPQSPLASMTD
ncbi:SWI/SNF complex subunit SMARCC2-like isoform X2 [Watersipora subatra]|uniref:SWI/SNF complex subunit SMARCC2-like isoform X2 n=1 Tax=Watersipora subatra TaxID=2589382 RepID=UPI00355BD600